MYTNLSVLRGFISAALILSGAVAAGAQAQVGGAQSSGAQGTTKSSGAQDPTKGPQPVAVPKPTSNIQVLNDEQIQLSPGDAIQIQVDNHAGIDGLYTVPGTGKLLLPEAGLVQVGGLTTVQFQTNLQKQLEKCLNNVYVRVLLREVNSRRASINGLVLNRGSVNMGTNEYRLLDLIDVAGGLIQPVGRPDAKYEEYYGTLYRGRAVIPISLVDAYKQPSSDANFILQPGDRVNIDIHPMVLHEVHILGDIPRKGYYVLDNNTTLLGLFGQSGYPPPDASLNTSYVLRGDTKIPLNLRPLLSGEAASATNHFKFQDEDELYIPTILAKYMVWGQVGHQGDFTYPEFGKVTILDALQGAGISTNAELRHVQLTHMVNGKLKTDTINVDNMVHTGAKDKVVLIQKDDVVWVPARKPKYTPSINDIFTPLTLLAYFGIHPY
jgi:protein involved in polysaccharide export with SLBB domain